MKRIGIYLLFLAGLVSCSEDENKGPDNNFIAAIELDGKKIEFQESTIINTVNKSDTLYMMIFALHTDGIEYDTKMGSFKGKGHLMYSNFTSPVNLGIQTGTYTYNYDNNSNFHFRGGIIGTDLDFDTQSFGDMLVFLGGQAAFIRNNDSYTFTPQMEAEPYIDFENDITDPDKRTTITGNFQVTPKFLVALEE